MFPQNYFICFPKCIYVYISRSSFIYLQHRPKTISCCIITCLYLTTANSQYHLIIWQLITMFISPGIWYHLEVKIWTSSRPSIVASPNPSRTHGGPRPSNPKKLSLSVCITPRQARRLRRSQVPGILQKPFGIRERIHAIQSRYWFAIQYRGLTK